MEQMYTDLSAGTAVPNFPTGYVPLFVRDSVSHVLRWEAAPLTSVTFQVPDNWKAGRIWVRTSIRSAMPRSICHPRVDVIAISRLQPDQRV